MPYVSECRVLQREPNAVVFYEHLALPFIHDRDFTLRTKFTQSRNENGTFYLMHWEPANDLGPAPIHGVIRVKHCEGGWLLEPLANSTTRATYTIYTDSGGAVPAWVENRGSRIAIRKLFEAVRKQVKDAKYAEVK